METNKENYYDSDYYRSHCGDEYDRGNGWEEIFGNYANRIVKEIAPQKTLDVGCAKGFFVEALRDRGVEAYGFDISEYAISQVREDIKPYCKVQSALLPIGEKYDLITCIEVLEHLDNKDIPLAVQRICEATDDVIFSSTPFDYDEESHISIHTPAYWAEQFAYNGFYHDVQYDCSYIAVQTMRFRRMKKTQADLIREYESVLFEKTQEITAVRHNYQMAEDNVQIYRDAYQKHVDMINQELNPRIIELEGSINQIRENANAERKLIEKEYEDRLLSIRNEIESACRNQLDTTVKRMHEAERKHREIRLHLEHEVQRRKKSEDNQYKMQDEILEKTADLDELDLKYRNLVLEKNQLEVEYRKLLSGTTVLQFIKLRFREYRLLKKSMKYWVPVFDAEYYANKYPDLKEAFGNDKKALLKHFVKFGMSEGRQGRASFNVYRYMELNPDIREIYKTNRRGAYMHYIEYGLNEDRKK